MRFYWLHFFWFVPARLIALFFANPAQPAIQTEGILNSPRDWYSLRIGYASDYLYHQQYDDEFPQIKSPTSYVKLITDASLFTLNIRNCFDFNVLIGSSQIQIDHEVFSKRQFAWAAGAKFLLFQSDLFFLAFDFKYFESKQKPQYFVSEGYAFNLLSKLRLDYYEMQAAFGVAAKASNLFPYLYATYIYSKIYPNPLIIVLKYPSSNRSFDTTSRSVIDKERWGIALGATLLVGSQGSLTVETRLFNQNAVSVTGEVRF